MKVTYRAEYKVKQGRKWINKISEFTEEVKTEADARLRALALNWIIVKIETVKDGVR